MKPKSPTKAAIEARATVSSEDVFAGRSLWQRTSEEQQLPQGDNRFRVSYSAKFYIVQLMGEWLHVSESAERIVRTRNGCRRVTFENKEYELKKATHFKSFIRRFVQGGCYAYIGGKEVHTERELNKVVEQRFIYIASSEALNRFDALRETKRVNK